jgi:4'-phosphopantetheinyl transferase
VDRCSCGSKGEGDQAGALGSVAAALDPATVRVRWLVVDGDKRPDLVRWRGMLDSEELARADRFRFDADRNIYTAAHALARRMLSEATGLPTMTWRYVLGEFGKPALAPNFSKLNLQFNISHTRGLVACAIAYNDVGVDIERVDQEIDLGIAHSYFSPEEVRALVSAPQSQQVKMFFRFWSLKEAFIKATGEGLRRPLDSFSLSPGPLQIAFHPARNYHTCRDDPAEWQFWEWLPTNDSVASLAVRSSRTSAIRLDARPARATEINPL